jgi:hypothetical protein
VQPNWIDHRRPEVPTEPRRPCGFVSGVDPAVGHVFPESVQQMADVVEQGRRNQLWPGARLFREVSTLKGVLGLGDCLAEVRARSILAEESEQPINNIHAIVSDTTATRDPGRA